MKFQVTMKCPDALNDSIDEAVREELGELALDQDERELVADSRAEKAREFCRRWFEYGEYLTVEVDTEAGTCAVVENRR